MKKHCLSLLRIIRRGSLLAAGVIPSVLSAALLIDFENPAYIPGDLYNQGISTKWGGAAGRGIAVSGHQGVGGSAGAVTSRPTSTAELTYNPSTVELPGFTAQSKVAFSFQYRYLEQPTGDNSNFVMIFGYANTSNYATRLSLKSNGGVLFNSGASASHSVKVDGQNYLVPDAATWTTISGVIDYAAGTYTLFVNDEEQTLASGPLTFWGAGNPATGRIRFQNIVPPAEGAYVPVVIDNLKLQVIPEPMTGGLMALVGVGFMLIYFRANRVCRL